MLKGHRVLLPYAGFAQILFQESVYAFLLTVDGTWVNIEFFKRWRLVRIHGATGVFEKKTGESSAAFDWERRHPTWTFFGSLIASFFLCLQFLEFIHTPCLHADSLLRISHFECPLKFLTTLKRGMALLHALMCRWNTSMSLQRSLSASRIANCWLRCAVLFDIHTFSMYPSCIDLHTRARAIFFHIDTFCFAIQDMWKPFVHNFWGAHPMLTDKSREHRTTEPRRPIVSTHLWMSEESALSNPLCRVALQASEYQNESQWSWIGLYSNQVFEGFTRFMNLVMLNQIISVLIHVLFIECDLLEECIEIFRDPLSEPPWSETRHVIHPSLRMRAPQKIHRSHFFDVCFGFVCFGFSALY